MNLDDTHQTVQVLRSLLPSCWVAGGSFAGSLPHPADIAPDERRPRFETMRRQAVGLAVEHLLVCAGFPCHTSIGHLPSGARNWPMGYVGSLTDKGTVVLAAMASEENTASLGIDLEHTETGSVMEIAQNIAPEGLPVGVPERLGALLSFSAKEAVFKALSQARLGFEDVKLTWNAVTHGNLSAVAVVSGGLTFNVQCAVLDKWLVSVATR